ncbi:YoaK family protein [Pseudomonas sp. Pseu.R1]|uniref:YoaK family protein n=1 Tax=Pseudomonas sp. Pseu.R1 TaxID=3379818 RepID=UPI003B95DFBE
MLPETITLNDAAKRMAKMRGRVGLCFVASLSIIAGMTDAIGFMVAGDFVSFMSGNTTRLAVAAGSGNGALVVHIGMLIAAFVFGNAVGVIAARMSRRRAWPLLMAIGGLLCLCGLMDVGAFPFLLAVLAMGMINAVVEEVNGLPIGLTYVTGALSRFGRGLGRWIIGERRNGWRVQLIPWGGMLLGAILGGVLAQSLGIKAMLVSGATTFLLAMLSAAIPRSWQLSFMPK